MVKHFTTPTAADQDDMELGMSVSIHDDVQDGDRTRRSMPPLLLFPA